MTPEVTAALKKCDIAGDTVAFPLTETFPRPLFDAVSKELIARGGAWRGGKTKFIKLPPGASETLRAELADH